MAWGTIRETLIRRYCRAVRLDTPNFPDLELQAYWDDAHAQLKSLLCPPFVVADFEKLNGADTNSESGNLLIAMYASLILYKFLPGKTAAEEEKLELFLFGDGESSGYITKLENGDATLFATGDSAPLASASLIKHNRAGYKPTFSTSDYDTSGNLVGNSGSLDDFG